MTRASPVFPAIDGAQLRILVVEDDSLIADLMIDALEEAGFEVVGPTAKVGEALILVETDQPDAAVLDVSLGGERSFPIARDLAQRGIPFIFMTGYSDGDIPAEFRERPVLTKPVKLRILTDRLRAMCLETPGAAI